jgi:hypothetical protein
MPATVVAKGLYCGDGARLSGFGIKDSFEKGVQEMVGTMTKSGKQLTVILEINAQDLRQSEYRIVDAGRDKGYCYTAGHRTGEPSWRDNSGRTNAPYS